MKARQRRSNTWTIYKALPMCEMLKSNPVLPGAYRGEGNHMNGEKIYFSFASISESRFFTVVYFFGNGQSGAVYKRQMKAGDFRHAVGVHKVAFVAAQKQSR